MLPDRFGLDRSLCLFVKSLYPKHHGKQETIGGRSVIALRSIPAFVFTAHVATAGRECSAMTALVVQSNF